MDAKETTAEPEGCGSTFSPSFLKLINPPPVTLTFRNNFYCPPFSSKITFTEQLSAFRQDPQFLGIYTLGKKIK